MILWLTTLPADSTRTAQQPLAEQGQRHRSQPNQRHPPHYQACGEQIVAEKRVGNHRRRLPDGTRRQVDADLHATGAGHIADEVHGDQRHEACGEHHHEATVASNR